MNIIAKIKEIKRKLYLRYITGNKGFVIETNDKIICYVKEDKIDDGYLMDLSLRSKNTNLNKRICYVFDNINSNKMANIMLRDKSEIIIKDCDFKRGLQIGCNGKCVIDNSNIRVSSSIKYSVIADELEIKNIKENMINFLGTFQLGLCARKELVIKNCDVLVNNHFGNLLLTSENNLNIDNSSINGFGVTINAPKIRSRENAVINVDSKVKIYSNDFDDINVNTSVLELNGKSIDTRNKMVTLRKIANDVEQKRLELIECLKKVKDKVNEENQSRLNDYQKELENKPLKKLMK